MKGTGFQRARLRYWERAQSLSSTVEPHLIDLNPDEPRSAQYAMPRTREDILEERRQFKAKYGDLFDSTAALLFRHDPVGINFEVNHDEYQAETGTILPRLHGCQSADDVCRVVHEEFIRWFGAATAGPPDGYMEIASEILQLWQVFRQSTLEFQRWLGEKVPR